MWSISRDFIEHVVHKKIFSLSFDEGLAAKLLRIRMPTL